jgi:hypothetical protein
MASATGGSPSASSQSPLGLSDTMSDEETSQGNSRWLLVAGCWLLVAGCWLLVAGCWLLVAGCWLLHVKKLAEQLEGGEEKPT